MTDRSNLLNGVPRLEFSKEKREEYESNSNTLLQNTLIVYDEFHQKKNKTTTKKEMMMMKHSNGSTSHTWKLIKRRKSLNVYRNTQPFHGNNSTLPTTTTPTSSNNNNKVLSRHDQVYLCSGVMSGSVEDIIHGAYTADIESMRVEVSMVKNVFLDARILHMFETNPITSTTIFSGIKWVALKTSLSASLVHDRDFLFYNRLGRFIDAQGRYFVYCIVNSIELEEFPANEQPHLKRGYVSMCYLFRQLQDELLGCFILGSSNMGGSFPRSVVDMISAERMLSVTNLLVVARAKAYSARIADSTDRIPSTSKSCDVCMKKPSLLRSSLRLCMGCRRNACRKCRESCTVFRLNLRTQKPSKEIFCTQCISDVTRPTMSAFHMCSLHENTNDSVNHYQCVGLDSVVSGEKNSTGHSSNRSHDSSDIDSDAWLPAPIDLDGLASFVERASVATSGELQWNQDELDHYADILRESGHFEIPQFSDQNNNGNCQRSQNQKQDYDPSNSLPSSVYFKFNPKVSRSYATDNSSAPKDAHHKFFCADDLD